MRMKTWLVCLALLLPWVASAEFIADVRFAKDDPCGPFEVVHINGVLTDRPGAQQNLDRLAAVYGNGHNGHVITYRLAHNQTQGPVDDLIEMWLLKLKEDPSITFTVFTQLWQGLLNPTTLQATIMNAIRAKLATYDLLPVLPTDPAVALIAAQIRAPAQLPKYKTVLVGHSQGTAYAVEVMNRLIAGTGLQYPVPAGSISMVSLGAAAGTLKGPSAAHATSTNDFVIGALRTFSIPVGFTVLSSNITIPVLPGDWLGHNLQRVYMAHAVGQKAFVDRLKVALNAVKSPADPPARWMRSVGQMYYCGTLPLWYGPGPWQCYIDSQYFTTNTMRAPIAGSYGMDLRAGTLAMAQTAATAHATGCRQMYVNDRIAQLTANTYILKMIPGCGYSYPATYNYAWDANTAWMIHSADSVSVRVSYELYPPIQYVQAGNDVVKVETYPVCRRA